MPRKTADPAVIALDHVQSCILLIRGQRVILAADLARLYGVTTKRLNEAVKRNTARFPGDFMFQLTREEAERSRSQIATLNVSRRGSNMKYLPYAFTEHGAIMAATVLNSIEAVNASLFVVRAFIKLRELLASHEELRQKLDSLERKLSEHDEKFAVVFDAIRQLMDGGEEPDGTPEHPFGFHPKRLTHARKR
jgi:hypothetical protein